MPSWLEGDESDVGDSEFPAVLTGVRIAAILGTGRDILSLRGNAGACGAAIRGCGRSRGQWRSSRVFGPWAQRIRWVYGLRTYMGRLSHAPPSRDFPICSKAASVREEGIAAPVSRRRMLASNEC